MLGLAFSFLSLIPNAMLRPIGTEENIALISGDLKIESGFKALMKSAPSEKILLKALWANEMWSFENGGICRRKDKGYQAQTTWADRYRYIELNPLEEIIRERSSIDLEKRVQNLSPTEKYDLLMGNLDAPLTRFFWNYQKELNDKKELFSWRGVCEGSAAASAFWRGGEPIRSLRIPSIIVGLKISFSALDLKALAAIAFSQFQAEIPFLGLKNLNPKPDKGQANEFLSPESFSLNPATLFLAVLNLGAIHGLPLIMDKEPLQPVWSVPIQSYRYRILGSIDTKRDIYSHWRHAKATEIIEVEMKLEYADVNRRGIREEGRVAAPLESLKMKFDLELNCQDPEYPNDCKILGGEWREDPHPDFLYALFDEKIPWSEPETRSSFKKGLWSMQSNSDELQEVPHAWIEPAREAGTKGQILWSVVSRLVEVSSK